ncbi:MAG: nitrite/sulfite reductase, partial [Gammaproteobacteria bacterium]
MYRYDEYDHRILRERVAQYRSQVERYLAGELSEDELRPLRLQNGLYIQRLAPMLRIAVPYGLLSSTQLRKLAHITRHYDKGYAHFTTRQNVQLNWPALAETPDILAELAEVEMHAIQTSGNCIRNITADQFSGVAADEIEDARPWCELLRQWSTFHPEFAYLPRKFKIAVSGSQEDRAAVRFHDIGLILKKNAAGETGFEVLAGGGLGRTPVIGETVCDFLPAQHVITYCDAILRVYNRLGRRDNKYKARIKILVRAMGIDAFRDAVNAEWEFLQNNPDTLTPEAIAHAKGFFSSPAYETLDPLACQASLDAQRNSHAAFARWLEHNTHAHRQPGYAIVTVSVKETGLPPGDITDRQLEA